MCRALRRPNLRNHPRESVSVGMAPRSDDVERESDRAVRGVDDTAVLQGVIAWLAPPRGARGGARAASDQSAPARGASED